MIEADELVDQAEALLNLGCGPASSDVNFRRAISTAYYAAFHAVCGMLADMYLGPEHRDTALYGLVYRGVSHQAIKRVASEIRGRLNPLYRRYLPGDEFGSAITEVADGLFDLQEKRHSADYDPLSSFDDLDAILAIGTARSILEKLKAAPETERRAFSAFLIFQPRP